MIAKGEEGRKIIRKAIAAKEIGDRGLCHALWVLDAAPDAIWMTDAMKLFHHANPEVVREAVRLFDGSLRESAPLAKELDSKIGKLAIEAADPQIRLIAIQALAALQEDQDIDILVRLLAKETDPLLRMNLVRSVKTLQPWLAFMRFSNTIAKQPDPLGSEGVFQVLSEVYDKRAADALIELSKNPSREIRKGGANNLQRQCAERKPYPGTWWGTQPANTKPPAREIAWEGTPLIRDAILAALGDEDASVRKAAVEGLIVLHDPETLPQLIGRLEKETALANRVDLVRAISGLKSEKAVPTLSVQLLDAKGELDLRLEALKGLESVPGAKSGDAIVQAAMDSPPRLKAEAIEALGKRKNSAYYPVCAKGLGDGSPLVRMAAVHAFMASGDLKQAPQLRPLLQDSDLQVRTSAIQAIGMLKAIALLPDLLPLADQQLTQFEAIKALSAMPDVRALSAYLTGLSSKNNDLRTAARLALTTVREPAADLIQSLADRKELPSAILPELRTIYAGHAPILEWNLIGPFPRGKKSHPPEQEINLSATYPGVEKPVKWIAHFKADASQHGKVKLDSRFSPSNEVEAYGYTEIDVPADRDAQLLVGSDDSIVIWLNGKKVHQHDNDRGWDYNADTVNVKLVKGVNKLLVKCGNSGGAWEFSVAVTGETSKYKFLQGSTAKLDLNDYRDFARKMKGDAEKGKKLFVDVKGLACVKCHAIGGEGGKVGPDLAGLALKYGKEELITSVLEPSKTIANGYETLVVLTSDGRKLTGVFKGETGDTLNLMDADAKLISIPKGDVEKKSFSPISTMPNGLNEGMTLQDFADLIAYLEARREEPTKK